MCLDCEEVHDAPQCPTCASESFAFITRWVPAPERRERPRTQEPARPAELQAYRTLLDAAPPNPNGTRWRLVGQGAMGLALVGVAGWLWKAGGASRAEKDRQ